MRRPRLRRLPRRLGRARRAGGRQHAGDVHRRLPADDHRARCAAISGSPDVNVFGYCFGGVLSLLSVAGNPDVPVRSLAVMATPVDFAPHGPDDVDDAGGPRRARRPPRRHRQRAGRRDAQLVPGAPAARRRHRLRQPVAAPLERRVRRRPPGDDAVVHGTTSRSRARRSCQMGELFAPPEPAGDRAACRSAGAPSTSPTSPCRSSTSSARRTTSCRRRRSALLDRLVGSDRRRGAAPAGRARRLIVGRTAQRRNIPAMADWLERHAEPL